MFEGDDFILQELSTNRVSLESIFSETSSSSSSVSSDSDFERLRVKRTKIINYVENVVKNYSDEEFKIYFRINRSTANRIISHLDISNVLPKHSYGREKINSEKAFLLTLWYLSNTETFRQVADRFNVSESSSHRDMKKVLDFLLSHKSSVIKWPDANRAREIESKFRRMKGIRNVIGCIDGSHIEIPKPKENQESYCNRKGYHSLLLQGIVDCDKKFIDVFCGEPGSMNDARLLRKSPIYAEMQENPNFMGEYFILGDSAYPSLNWIVPPFIDYGNLTRQHREFNYFISATRIVVENAFGLLKGRFRLLRRLDNVDKMLCSKIILCCCILHNICIDENDYFSEMVNEDFNQPNQYNEVEDVRLRLEGDRRARVFDEIFNV